MNLMKVAHVPPVVVEVSASVADAVDAMVSNLVGAVAVVENGVLRGIISERDVVKKVVHAGRAAAQTRVADVMTTEVESIFADTPASEALQIMIDGYFRHLPIVDGKGKVLGILSIRNFLQNRVEELEDSINSITSYYAADGAGG